MSRSTAAVLATLALAGAAGCGDTRAADRDARVRLGIEELLDHHAELVEGRAVETTNGLANGPELHALQQSFMDGFAAQCGYCTPGMLMAAKALLDRNPTPSRDEVIEAISGNICRCTGYEPIVEAILSAAQARGRVA